MMQNVSAQQYASSVSSAHNDNGLATASVNNEGNAAGAADGNHATLSASGIVVVIAFVEVTQTSSASLTFNLPESVPAGKRSYIKINPPSTNGLDLNLGSLVNLLNLFTNQTIRTSAEGTNAPATLVRDGSNNLYIAVTPDVAYNDVTLTLDFGGSVSLAGAALGSISLEVDNITTYETTDFTPCQALPFAFTGVNPNATGISAAVLSGTLQEPYKAIDGVISPTNYSVLQNGAVAAASTVSQTFFLGKTSPQGNQVLATISKPGALANLSVLGNIFIQAYLGSTPVGGARSINSLLVELDLLTLFQNNGLTTVSFVPTSAFDRVVVTSTTLLNANIFTGLLIHELSSRPPIAFTGGNLPSGRVGANLSVNLDAAANLAGTPNLPGFSISCGGFGDYTYTLEGVSLVNGRTQTGTLTEHFNPKSGRNTFRNAKCRAGGNL